MAAGKHENWHVRAARVTVSKRQTRRIALLDRGGVIRHYSVGREPRRPFGEADTYFSAEVPMLAPGRQQLVGHCRRQSCSAQRLFVVHARAHR